MSHTEELLKKSTTYLNQYFGYSTFRPSQKEIIEALYNSKDVLVLMPTGGGKSLCYQIPAITLDGVGLVISPLISLMQDQVESLKLNGIKAEYINSTLSTEKQAVIEQKALSNELDILYISPEKIMSPKYLSFIQKISINIIAIDEAHCISSWGHDFRPEYTQIGQIKKKFPSIPFIALTATADQITRNDIIKQLHFDKQKTSVFISSFNRPNLSLEVRYADQRINQIDLFIKERPKQSGIIYAFSRKKVEQIASQLKKRGITCAYYHAGMSAKERQTVQQQFIEDKIDIICATVAFGMGIDKSSVRWVIHYNLPKNIESFYQEIGRAGRDGLPSSTLLFYSFADVVLLHTIIEKGPNKELYISKLKRMQEYAESLICRRQYLLSYFDEKLKEACQNCDVCQTNHKQFDGTIAVQKALSIIARLKQKIGISTVVDILVGSVSKNLIHKNYHKIKTYAQGKEFSKKQWTQFLRQMISYGYVDLSLDQYQQLKLNQTSCDILTGNKKVNLVEIPQHPLIRTSNNTPQNTQLFDQLRELRMKIARQEGVPPYMVFSDATLKEMVISCPINKQQMLSITGVGEHKLSKYGDLFLQEISQYQLQNTTLSENETTTF